MTKRKIKRKKKIKIIHDWLAHSIFDQVRKITRKRGNILLCRVFLATIPGRMIFLWVLSYDSRKIGQSRSLAVQACGHFLGPSSRILEKLKKATQARYKARQDKISAELYMLFLLTLSKYRQILEMRPWLEEKSFLDDDNIASVFRFAQYEIGYFQEASQSSKNLCIREKRPKNFFRDATVARGDYFRGAYAAGMSLDKKLALWIFAHQYGFDSGDGVLNDEKLKYVEAVTIGEIFVDFQSFFVESHLRGKKIGVFFLHQLENVGHAILDSYHFLALSRGCYDRVYFIGGHLDKYDPGPRTAIKIATQYGKYLETENDKLMNLSWMALGTFKIDNITVVVENYWSLFREVCHRARNPDDAFAINAWHMTLPKWFDQLGERFCKQHYINLDQPIVTLHARDQKYHNIEKQSFRNSPIADYELAILHLLDLGYQVIRLGDRLSPELPLDHEGYFEIPFLEGYENGLDPFFISQSEFLIGCQSGPCGYARALGIPVLSVNAVFSYTLLPAIKEMACFKRYLRIDNQGREHVLSYEEIMADNIFQMENKSRLELSGLSIRNCTPEEIDTAVQDMIAWVKQPDLELTAEQEEFRVLVNKTAERIKTAPDNEPKIADYLGIALPGYRVSPGVEKMRRADAGSKT